MSIVFAENFDYYGLDSQGQGTALMAQGFWSSPGSTSTISVPVWETQGKRWLNVNANGGGTGRRSLGTAKTGLGGVTRLRFVEMPTVDLEAYIVQQRDSGAVLNFYLTVRPDGNIRVHNSAGTVVTQTATPCIFPGVSHKIAWQMTYAATTGTCEVRVDNVVVIGGTSSVNGINLVMVGTASLFEQTDGTGGSLGNWAIDFTVVYDLGGTFNNNFPSISGVKYLTMTGNPVSTFTPRPRQIFGAGLLQVPGTGSLLDCSTSALFDVGSGAFTIETRFRPTALATGSQIQTLFGKWLEATNNRSYRLVQYGPSVNGGALRFEISTDGTTGGVVVINSAVIPWVIGRIYSVAVSRSAGVTRLFVDGIQYGVSAADTNTYFATGVNAKFTVGGEMSNTSTTVLANSSPNARYDEFRHTVGVGRYTANYTPSAVIFPRTVGGDPSFASVQLLFGLDNTVVDESTTSVKTLALRGSAIREVNTDGLAGSAFLVANNINPTDDTYLEAAFIKAQNILQFTGQPLNTQTVTVGATTYTFNTVLGGANSILIGATQADSMQNLIDAVNLGPGIGVRYGAGTLVNATAQAALGPATASDITMIAATAGTAGNTIVTTETVTTASFLSGVTMVGGQNIPGFSDYTITALPPTATGVRALVLVDRSFVDADNATLRKSLNVSGSIAAGADNTLTTSPAYRADVFETDPSTSAAMTPTTVVNTRIRLTRTT